MKSPRNDERESHAEMLRGLDTRPAEEAKPETRARTVNLLMVVAALIGCVAAIFLK